MESQIPEWEQLAQVVVRFIPLVAELSLLSTSMSGCTSAALLGFPVELVQHILAFCHPWDVAAFSQTCRAAFALVYHSSDQYLWCQLYVNQFDVPKLAANPSATMKEKFEWKKELTNRMAVEVALFRGPTSETEMKNAFATLIAIINELSATAPSTGSSLTVKWLKRVVSGSLLLSNLYNQDDTAEDVEMHCQLRSCLAMTLDSRSDKKTFKILSNRRDQSRAYVYDLRNYRASNRWGPFKYGGAVNWIHVEHLINVTALNIRELPENWADTRPPSCLDPPRFASIPPAEGSPFNDWAGVEGGPLPRIYLWSADVWQPPGTWRRYVCFMDYR